MKKFIYPTFALLLFSCGGEAEGETSEDNNDSNTDTTSVDSTSMEIEGEDTWYFEDYAQYNTKTALYEAYGEENLKDDETWYAEGTVKVVITMLTDPENGNVIQYSWGDDEETLSFIETWNNNWRDENAKDQRIESKEGVYTGMPLSEIVVWSGGDFEFSGFGWDYAGGTFGGDDNDKINTADIGFTLTMADDGYEDYLHLLGDGAHSTMDQDVTGAPIMIGTMTYSPK